MHIDHLAVLQSEAARILDAYAANPSGRVPWSDRWTVNTVARHVGGSHHVVAQIIEDRPTANFGRFADLDQPAKGDPAFPAWFTAGTDALVRQCRAVPQDETCWSPLPAGVATVGYWGRHMANETLVHRWDAEAGAGVTGPAMVPEVAADAVDEFLDILLGATRAFHEAPAGPRIRLACHDVDQEWYLDLADAGRHTLHREPIDVALTVRGSSETLLLLLYGRIDPTDAELGTEGDRDVLREWSELFPAG